MELIQKLGVLLLCIQLFIACTREGGMSPEPPDPPEPPVFADSVNVVFRMRTAPVTYAMTDVMENHLETVDILAFKEDENSDLYFAYHVKGRDIIDINTSQKQFTASLKTDSSRYQFVILANIREEIERLGNLPETGTKEQVLAYILSKNTGKWDSSVDFQPIPMWGETNRMKIGNSTTITNVHLLRALSRIDLLISDNAQSSFKLRDVYIYNRKSRGHVIPKSDFWDSSIKKVTAPTMPEDIYPSEPLNIKGPAAYDSESEVELIRTIYTYESEGVELSRRTDATCLVIGGYYGTETTPSYYRIDLLNDAETAFRDLLRNHLYEIEVKSVSGSGYDTPDAAFEGRTKNMEVVITTWNLSTMEIVIEGSFSLKVSPSTFYLQDAEAHMLVSNIMTTYPRGWTFYLDPNDEADGFRAFRVENDLWIEVPANLPLLRPYYIDIKSGNLNVFIVVERKN